MSLNVNIELPIVTVLAIQDAASREDDAKALEDVRYMTDRVIIGAVKEIPLHVIQKAIIVAPVLPMPNINKKIQESVLQKIETAKAVIKICVRDMTGREYAFDVPHDATVQYVKEAVEERTDIPPVTQRLIYGGKQMRDNKKLDEVSFETYLKKMQLLRHQ